MNILFAASEAVPYAASGGLADVTGSLPKAINEKGNDCRVVIPLYKAVSPELRREMKFITNITVDVSWRKQYCGIFTAVQDNITYYFIENKVFETTKEKLITTRQKAILEKDDNYSNPVAVWLDNTTDKFTTSAQASYFICKYANMYLCNYVNM